RDLRRRAALRAARLRGAGVVGRRDAAGLAGPQRPGRARPQERTARHHRQAPPLTPHRRPAVDLNYSAEEIAFRDEVRAWLRESLPGELRDKVLNYRELTKDDLLRWHKILAKKGWVAPFWPREWGGTDWTVVQRYILEEECGAAGTPPIVAFGVRMCAPVLLRFGTDAQK